MGRIYDNVDDDVDDVVEEEEDGDVEDYDVDEEEEDRSQDRGNRFVRACAVEMPLDMSQEHVNARLYR